MSQSTLPAEIASLSSEAVVLALINAPPNTNIAESDLARKIIYTDNDPERWALICTEALRKMSYSRNTGNERYATLKIEEINGMRRCPKWNATLMKQLLINAEAAINCLLDVDDERKILLQGLHFYHGGLIYHALGDFAKAAECHETAAQLPGTSPLSIAIAKYCAAFERVCEFLAQKIYIDLVERALDGELAWSKFNIAANMLLRILDLQTQQGRQWEGNIAGHKIRLGWLLENQIGLNTNLKVKLNRLTIIERLPKELKPAFDDGLGLCYAISSLLWDNLRQAYWIANRLGNDPRTEIDQRCEALLLAAHIKELLRESEEAKEILEKLISLKGHGGHVARVIARRKLEKMNGVVDIPTIFNDPLENS